jgi:hypothetical protein
MTTITKRHWYFVAAFCAAIIVALSISLTRYVEFNRQYRSELDQANGRERVLEERKRTLEENERALTEKVATLTAKWNEVVATQPGVSGVVELRKSGRHPWEGAKNYSSTGEYLGYGDQFLKNGPNVKLDESGIPLIKYGDDFFYNPVSIALDALAEYSRKDGPSKQFMIKASYLAGMVGEDGALRYPFRYQRYATGEWYEPGWVSGMAQGLALSVFSRAFHLTSDQKFIAAGEKAMAFMLLSEKQGGPMTTLMHFSPAPSDAPFIMEYPQNPPVYTLNGFMFSIIGLYDWANVTGSNQAIESASQAISTLKILLPYYDLGTLTSYDLSYITVPKRPSGTKQPPHISFRYHVVHIQQLWALYKLTGDPILKDTADRWYRYMTDL